VPKFRRTTPPNSEVKSANLLHFKPIFDPPLKKVVKGAAVIDGGCASKTWSFSSACKTLEAQHPLGAEVCSSENATEGRSTLPLITWFVVDGISQIFFCSTPKGLLSSTPFRLCCYLHRFQRYLRSNSKVVVNRTDF